MCPEGKTMERVGQSKQKRSSVELVVLEQYRTAPGECAKCPRQQECCPKSKQGRSISRSEHEAAIKRLRARMSKAENKQKYKRRAATVERVFGDGKLPRRPSKKVETPQEEKLEGPLRIGDTVRVLSFGQNAELLGLSADRSEADVQMGALRTRVSVDNLERVSKRQASAEEARTGTGGAVIGCGTTVRGSARSGDAA